MAYLLALMEPAADPQDIDEWRIVVPRLSQLPANSTARKIMLNKFMLLILVLLVAFILLMLLFPRMNYRPMPEGLCKAALQDKPNWVSSMVDKDNEHYIEALGKINLDTLSQCLKDSGVNLTEQTSEKLTGFRRSHYFHFTDWFCITSDGNITSSATIGHSDLGNNRAWVSRLRKHCLDKA